jgi:hypothetical protein
MHTIDSIFNTVDHDIHLTFTIPSMIILYCFIPNINTSTDDDDDDFPNLKKSGF